MAELDYKAAEPSEPPTGPSVPGLEDLFDQAARTALADEQITAAAAGIDGADDTFLGEKLDKRGGAIWERVAAERRAYDAANSRFDRVVADVMREADVPAFRVIAPWQACCSDLRLPGFSFKV